jgi:ABC-type lipoprotein export system ATPase subunit
MKIVDQNLGLYLCDSHLLPTHGQGMKFFFQLYRSEYGQIPLFAHIHSEHSLHHNLTLLENMMLPLSLPAHVSPYRYLQDWLEQRSHYKQLVKLIGDLKRYPHETSAKEKWLVTLVQSQILNRQVLFIEDTHHLGFDLFTEKLIKSFFHDEIIQNKFCFMITDRPGHWLDISTHTVGYDSKVFIKQIKKAA